MNFRDPSPSGYAVVLAQGGTRWTLTGREAEATCDRQELLAAIAALEALPRETPATFASDSKYVVWAIAHGWPAQWRRRGWRTRGGRLVADVPLWERLCDLAGCRPVAWSWTPLHEPLRPLAASLASREARLAAKEAEAAWRSRTSYAVPNGTPLRDSPRWLLGGP